MVYFALSRALAVLEKRVHMTPATVGMLWRLITIEIADQHVITADPGTLPVNWKAQPAPLSTKVFGSAWVTSLQSLGLRVPSVIVPGEDNLLINPAHAALTVVKVINVEDYRLDPRLGP
jgi:RES domain-containing protein